MDYNKWTTCFNSEFDAGYSKGYGKGYENGFKNACSGIIVGTRKALMGSPKEDSYLSSKSIQLVNFNEKKGTTVVKWVDGTITKVKAQSGDKYNPEIGLAMCIAKKAMGNKGNYNDAFKKWLPKGDGTKTVC